MFHSFQIKAFPFLLKFINPNKISISLDAQIWYPEYVAFGKKVNVGKQVLIQNDKNSKYEKEWNVRLKSNVVIRPFCVLETNNGFIDIGENVYINYYTCIFAEGGVTIGDNSLIGPHCTIVASHHQFSDRKTLIKNQNVKQSMLPIVICEDVWIGANCVILQGITIGKGAVIGAGSIVTKDVPPYSVAVGVPAKVINVRN